LQHLALARRQSEFLRPITSLDPTLDRFRGDEWRDEVMSASTCPMAVISSSPPILKDVPGTPAPKRLRNQAVIGVHRQENDLAGNAAFFS